MICLTKISLVSWPQKQDLACFSKGHRNYNVPKTGISWWLWRKIHRVLWKKNWLQQLGVSVSMAKTCWTCYQERLDVWLCMTCLFTDGFGSGISGPPWRGEKSSWGHKHHTVMALNSYEWDEITPGTGWLSVTEMGFLVSYRFKW